MIPAIWNYLVGYLVGTGIAVIGLYVAFILPVILRFRLGDKFEHGAWSLGKHYKWIDPIAIVWVAFISILFLLAALQGRASRGSVRGLRLGGSPTTRRSSSAARCCSSAAGGALGRRSGSRARSGWAREEELEQLEQQIEDIRRGCSPEPAA